MIRMTKFKRCFMLVALMKILALFYISSQKGVLWEFIGSCEKPVERNSPKLFVLKQRSDGRKYSLGQTVTERDEKSRIKYNTKQCLSDQEMIGNLKSLISDLIDLRVSLDGSAAEIVERKYDKFQRMLIRLEAASGKNESKGFSGTDEGGKRNIVYSCPEERKGSRYNLKFERINCSKLPISESVSIIIDSPGWEGKSENSKLLEDIRRFDKEIKVFRTGWGKENISRSSQLNSIIRQIKTPFVYLARYLSTWDENIDLERLLHVISSNDDVVAVGNAVLNATNGYWSNGCYQARLTNYTLIFGQGYQESKMSCINCDILQGPFITKVQYLREFPFEEDLESSFYLDWFLRIKNGLVGGPRNKHERKGTMGCGKEFEKGVLRNPAVVYSCPDVLSRVFIPRLLLRRFTDLAEKWEIKKMIDKDGRVEWFGCKRGIEHRMPKCRIGRGMAVPPCCLENLADAIKFIMRLCEENKIRCELQEGTLLGAVKFQKLLPWERDADISFLSDHFDKLKSLENVFQKQGYTLIVKESPLCCINDTMTGGALLVKADGWNIEMYGSQSLGSHEMIKAGDHQTKINFAGSMVNVPENPGKVARNRYGNEIYKHAEHWMNIKMNSGWDDYIPGNFNKCERPGHHGCLDQYEADGSLQFEERHLI